MLMNIEAPKAIPPLQELEESYKQKLNSVLYKQLTIENINTFADEALTEIVSLIDEILNEYKSNNILEPNLNLSIREQEDDAFNKLNLPNLQETLQIIINVKTKIDNLKSYLHGEKDTTNKTLIPAQETNPAIISGSGEGIKEKKLVPRLITLLYLIDADFQIPKENIKITEGQVTPDMMRKTPYVQVKIPELERLIYICDEEGNASYVFDTNKLNEIKVRIEDIDISDKSIINDLIEKYPGVGKRIIQTKNWRANISELLSQPILKDEKKEITSSTSEFAKKEKKIFLDFENFQKEVKSLYSKEANISKWYNEERKKHPKWPTKPEIKYRDSGWASWQELVGKKYLSFDVFQVEIKTL